MSVLLADIDATCAALGYNDGKKYQAEPDAAQGLKIDPPPHSVFPCEEASEVIRKLCASEIPGRAILRFHDID